MLGFILCFHSFIPLHLCSYSWSSSILSWTVALFARQKRFTSSVSVGVRVCLYIYSSAAWTGYVFLVLGCRLSTNVRWMEWVCVCVCVTNQQFKLRSSKSKHGTKPANSLHTNHYECECVLYTQNCEHRTVHLHANLYMYMRSFCELFTLTGCAFVWLCASMWASK